MAHLFSYILIALTGSQYYLYFLITTCGITFCFSYAYEVFVTLNPTQVNIKGVNIKLSDIGVYSTDLSNGILYGKPFYYLLCL